VSCRGGTVKPRCEIVSTRKERMLISYTYLYCEDMNKTYPDLLIRSYPSTIYYQETSIVSRRWEIQNYLLFVWTRRGRHAAWTGFRRRLAIGFGQNSAPTSATATAAPFPPSPNHRSVGPERSGHLTSRGFLIGIIDGDTLRRLRHVLYVTRKC
jgi:hypothetical protein